MTDHSLDHELVGVEIPTRNYRRDRDLATLVVGAPEDGGVGDAGVREE